MSQMFGLMQCQVSSLKLTMHADFNNMIYIVMKHVIFSTVTPV